MSGTADAGRLLVKIEATSAQLRQELDRANQQIAGFSSKAQQQVSQIGSAWQGVGAGAVRAGVAFASSVVSVAAVTAAIADMAKAAKEAENSAKAIGYAINNMDRGRQVYDSLARSAQQTGVAASDAAQSFTRLYEATRQFGTSTTQAQRYVETLQQLGAVTNSSTQATSASIQSLATALAQGSSGGAAMRSALDGMPALAQELGVQLGKSVDQIRDLAAQGKLTATQVLPAIAAMSDRVAQRLAEAPLSMERATASLSTSWGNVATQIARAAGESQTLARAVQAIANGVQNLADQIAPPATLDRLRTAREELERIEAARQRIAQRGQGTIQPEVTAQRRGGINTGLQRAAQGQTDTADRGLIEARRVEIAQLEALARAEADHAFAMSNAEVQAAALTAAERARQQVIDRVSEAQAALGGVSSQTQAQMAALRTVVAEGDGALAKYGITAGQAGAMLAALQEKAGGAAGVIAGLNQQLAQGAANAIGGFAGRLNQALVQAAAAQGGDATQLDPVQVLRIGQQLAQLAEQQGRATLQQAQNEAALARARIGGNAAAASRVQAEQRYQENLRAGMSETTAAAIRTQQLAAADAQAASASMTRLQPIAQVRQALQLEADHARNLAQQSTLGAQAQRVATEQDKARAEALKVARDGTAAYNAAYAEFLGLIQRGSRDTAAADINARVRSLNDEIALIQTETSLIGALPGVREAEIAALRVRQELIASGKAYTEEEIQQVQNLVRARERANVAQRQVEETLSKIRSTSEEISRDVATMMFEQMMDKGKGRSVEEWFKALFKRIAIQALSANIILPITTQIVGGMPGLFGISTGGASQAQIATALAAQQQASGGGGLLGALSSYQSGSTLLGSFPSLSGYSNGLVGSGVGQAFNPGYQMSGVYGYGDALLNTPLYGQGLGGATNAALANASYGYGPATAAEVNAAAAAGGGYGMTLGQAGLGALGIAGGAYGVYSGLQMGGAKGYTQAAGGAVGIAGGAAGLTVASGATAAGGALAGAAGTAIAATAAWAPYIAAALVIASMLMPGPKASNAAAGANINLTAGQVSLENSGKQTPETASARDQMAKLVTDTVDRMSGLLGTRPSGYLGFELGQRDQSRVIYNGATVGTAGVGDQQGLANLIGKTIMMGFRDAPNLSAVERRVLDAADSNVDMAANILQQTKAIKDNYGADALNYGRNYTTQALWSAAEMTSGGNIETMIAALGKAAELTSAYGDALGPINEVAKQATDMAWSSGNLDTIISAFQGAAELTKAYGAALDPNQNQAFRAIFDAAASAGDVKKFLAAMQGAAELTKAYGNALNSADALQVVRADGSSIEKIVTDLQWLFQVYRPLTGAEEQISALQKALEASNQTYNDAIAKARELGLAEGKLVENREKAAESIRQQVRDSYDDLMRQAQGMSSVAQAVADVRAAFQNYTTNATDYRAVGRDPAALYNAQLGAITKDMDFESLRAAAEQLKGLDQVAATFFEAAAAAAKATLEANEAAARAQAAANYDAAMREATGKGWVNQIINLAETVSANADAFRAAGRDPGALLAAQIQGVIDGLDAATLATAAANLQGLDSVTSDFVRAAITTAQATAAMADAAAQAAQRIADAADYDRQMRAAMGLDLVNTIVSIRQQIDAMASRYAAAGRDPGALYTAQVNASLQGKSADELAKTAAALQGIDTAAAALATSALEQAIAADAQAAAAEVAAQAARDAEQAQQAAARAAESAAREQEQAAQEAQRAAQQLAQAGQNIKDYIAKLKSGTSAGYSPTDRLAAAQSQYNADLALAQGGNLDALGRITGDADALISAAQAMYASGTQFQTIRDQIITQLNALPAVATAEQQMVDRLGSIDSRLAASNTSLSSISGTSASSSSKLDTANARLASIDTNNDGIVTIDEIQAAAKTRITEAQAALTTAAQGTLTKTGEVKDSIDAGNTTGYSDNNLLLGIYENTSGLRLQISDVRLDLAAINTLVDSVRKYTGAAAINTMYGRPVAQEPGIGAISAKGNLFGDGSLIQGPTAVPMSIMGEAGPEAVVPLERDARGRYGVRSMGGRGGAGNDNRPVVAAIERGWQQSAVETMALRDELRAQRAEIASLRSAMQRRNAS